MAANTSPIFVRTARCAEVTFVAADGTTPKDLVSAGADGTKVLRINCTSDDTATVEMQTFIHDGSAAYLLGTVDVPTLAGTVFATKDVPDGYDMYLRLGFDGIAGFAKLWTAADAEPGWDVSQPFEDWPEDETSGDDVLAITMSLGNDGGPAHVLTLRPLVIGGGALPGEAVAWQVVGTGDGATDTFETRYAFVPGTLVVRVDRQDIPAAGIAGKDGPGRSFTLTDPPYGDPSDPDGSAVVEARYTRA